ncbi:MAG: hypothetical protein ABII74_06755 [Elusimicrobiota bacterium]
MAELEKKRNVFLRAWDLVADIFEDEPADEPGYDPAHIGAMIVIVLFALAILFWLLWSLMVFEGGLFPKIIPFLKVVFTAKTLQDYGFEGYPYELGIFEGWIVNLAALIFLSLIITGIVVIFRKGPKSDEADKE